ncbi:MAG: hypothetical protein WCU88_05210 [Elusimicrobiota bacterium]|jgi:hypothetical protein
MKGMIAGLIFGALCAGSARAAMFNDVVPGARAMGMGMAYTAIAEGPEALFFNPAGLAASDYAQAQGGLGRMISPVGLLTYETMAYTRPLPMYPGATVGTAFMNLRQGGSGGDKDVFLLHGSYPIRVPQLYLKMPVKLGANLRFINVSKAPGAASKFGPGIDAGALIDSGGPLKLGASLTELSPDLKVPNPSLNLGASYRLWRRLTLAGDLRVRERLTQFFPGVEMDLCQQLLKARVGKGLPLDGVSQMSFGIGANFSPLIVDFAMTIPWQGFRRDGGASQLSLTYRFGAPPFSGRYIGSAARRAEDLRSDIADLEEHKKTLEAQSGAAETDRESLAGQVRALDERLKEVQGRLRESELRLERAQYDLAHPQPRLDDEPLSGPIAPAAQAPAVSVQAAPKAAAHPSPRPAAGPRKHLVKTGETLRSIAKEYYGDPALWERIYEANPDKIERGLPVEGSVLDIPARGR